MKQFSVVQNTYLLGKVELTFEKCLEMNQNRQMYYAYSSVRK